MKLTEIKAWLPPLEKAVQACQRYNIKYSKVHMDGTVDVDIDSGFFELKTTKLPIKFGIAKKTFSIQFAPTLNTLMGCPAEVKGEYFLITGVPKLTSLKGCTPIIGGRFEFYKSSITSLEGMPTEVGQSVVISQHHELKNLDFLPKKINGRLTILGCPKVKDYLKIFKIKGCTSVYFNNKQLMAIFDKYLPTRDMIGCQDALLDIPELEEYAD